MRNLINQISQLGTASSYVIKLFRSLMLWTAVRVQMLCVFMGMYPILYVGHKEMQGWWQYELMYVILLKVKRGRLQSMISTSLLSDNTASQMVVIS